MPELRCPNEKCLHSWVEDQAPRDEGKACPACGTRVSLSENAVTIVGPPEEELPVTLPSPAPAPTSATPPVPAAIGPYRIDRELGRGAFGVVYGCFDMRLKRAVAIKVLHETRGANPDLVQRFLREARAAANLNHPSIVAVYDLGRVGDQYYIASARVDGSSLDNHVKALVGDWRRTAQIVRDLANALAYAHRQQIIHRDVKPQNVMLNSAGQPMLMDFGLARWKSDLVEATEDLAGLADSADAGLTVAHQVLGTPAYMSPEQAAAKQDQVGPASDQYSLGVVLYQLLTGHLPLRGSAVEVLTALRSPQLTFPTPRERNAAVPPDLDAICRRALKRNPDERYADCDELARDLEDWLHGRPVSVRPLTKWERFRLWCRREPVVAGLTLGVAATILMGSVSSGLLAWRASDRASAAETALADESQARRFAQQQESAALAASAVATAERIRADDEAAAALRARDDAARRADEAEHMAYVSDMELIQQAWDRGIPDEMRRRLDRWTPVAEGTDRRRFEWHYWDRMLKSSPGARIRHAPTSAALSLPIPQTNLVLVQPNLSGDVVVLNKIVGDAGAERLEEVKKLTLPRGLIAMALSPQGNLATLDAAGTITLWNLPDLVEGRKYAAGTPVPNAMLTFEKSGNRLVVCGEIVGGIRHSLRRLDLESGQFDAVWTEPELLRTLYSSVQSIELAADGVHALIGGGLNISAWLNLETRAVEQTFQFPSSRTRFLSCRLSADGQRVFGYSIDGQLAVWDVATGQRQLVLMGGSQGRRDRLRLNRDTTLACIGTAFGQSQVWDLRSGMLIKVRQGCALPPEQYRTDQPERSPNVVVSQDQLWDPQYDPHGVVLSIDPASGPLVAAQVAMAFHPRSGELAVGGRFGGIQLLDPKTWTPTRTLTIEDPKSDFAVTRLRFQSAGDGLIAAASRGRAAYWDLKSDRGVFLPGEFRAESLSCVFIPGGSLAAVSSEARDIALWNLQDLTSAGQLVGHTNYQHEWAVHAGMPDEARKRTLTPSIQRDFASRTIVGYTPIEGMVVDLSAHPDGRYLASACGDGTVRVWDLSTRTEVWKHFHPKGTVQSVEFDGSGTRLAAGFSSGEIQIRDARTFELLSTLTGHDGGVLDVEFSPDGERLVTTSSDRTVRFWDLKTGQPVLRLDIWNSMNDPFAIVDQLAFHPDGTMLAGRTINVPRTVRIWQSTGGLNQPQVVIHPSAPATPAATPGLPR